MCVDVYVWMDGCVWIHAHVRQGKTSGKPTAHKLTEDDLETEMRATLRKEEAAKDHQVRERKREREGEGEKEREGEREWEKERESDPPSPEKSCYLH
jgi:hypothetical protein